MKILDRLSRELPELSPKLANAARYALDHPESMALDSMRSVANACDVASPTMLRLARHMGFDSYDDFKAEFQHAFLRQGFGERAGALKNTRETLGEQAVISQLFEASFNNLNRTVQQLDLNTLHLMAQKMTHAKTVYVVGLHWLASGLQASGRMALPWMRVPRAGDLSLVESLGPATPEDVVLTLAFRPYNKTTVDAARFAKKRGCTVLAISDKRSSPLLEFAEYFVLAPTDSPHLYPSMVAVLALIEALLAMVVANGDHTMADRISQLEALREECGAYLL